MSNADHEQQETHDEVRSQIQEKQFLVSWDQMRQQGMQASLRIAHGYSLSTSQFNLLGLLERMEGREHCTISWLSQHMSLDPATVVRAVDYLENLGLVARRRDTKDRRQVFVEFTEAGLTLQKELRTRSQVRLTTIFHSMSEQGRVALLEGLQEFLTLSEHFDKS